MGGPSRNVYDESDIVYTLTINARLLRPSLMTQQPGDLPVIEVTGDYRTLCETLAEIHTDASALCQLERFHSALTVPESDDDQ
jgi:hypothetical protein